MLYSCGKVIDVFNFRDDYKRNLLKSLEYIINRNHDIVQDNIDSEYLSEIEDTKFHRFGGFSHIVIVCSKAYTVSFNMTISDAKFILENIEHVEYLYNYDKGYDTVFFDKLRNVLSENHVLGYKYILFALGLSKAPTEKDALLFLKDRRNKYDS